MSEVANPKDFHSPKINARVAILMVIIVPVESLVVDEGGVCVCFG